MTESLNLQFEFEQVDFMDLNNIDLNINGKNYKILKIVSQDLRK